MTGQEKAERILDRIREFNAAVSNLDDEQVGDYKGLISPVKHAIRDALAPHLEALRQIAITYWKEDTEQKGA